LQAVKQCHQGKLHSECEDLHAVLLKLHNVFPVKKKIMIHRMKAD